MSEFRNITSKVIYFKGFKMHDYQVEKIHNSINEPVYTPIPKTIAGALVKAQKAFSPALKGSTNPHFKSRYADLAACVEAVIDGLNESGIFLTQKTRPCDKGVIVNTIFIHESGDYYDAGSLFIPATKADAQGFGSALTYARRYSLMSACGHAPEDDDGNEASKKKAADVVKISESQANEIYALIEENQRDKAGFMKYFSINQIEDLPVGQFKRAKSMLEAKK